MPRLAHLVERDHPDLDDDGHPVADEDLERRRPDRAIEIQDARGSLPFGAARVSLAFRA